MHKKIGLLFLSLIVLIVFVPVTAMAQDATQMGEIKHLEVPILVGFTVIGGLWFFYHHRRRSKGPLA